MGRQVRRHKRRNQRRRRWQVPGEPIDITLGQRPVDHEAFPEEGEFGVDANGCLTELIQMGDMQILVHYDDLPDCDKTIVDGIPCTTALRTIIDVAVELAEDDLQRTIDDALERRLFTLAEAWDRLNDADMAQRPGAIILRQVLPPPPA